MNLVLRFILLSVLALSSSPAWATRPGLMLGGYRGVTPAAADGNKWNSGVEATLFPSVDKDPFYAVLVGGGAKKFYAEAEYVLFQVRPKWSFGASLSAGFANSETGDDGHRVLGFQATIAPFATLVPAFPYFRYCSTPKAIEAGVMLKLWVGSYRLM